MRGSITYDSVLALFPCTMSLSQIALVYNTHNELKIKTSRLQLKHKVRFTAISTANNTTVTDAKVQCVFIFICDTGLEMDLPRDILGTYYV